jgi:hypothetical protein
MGALSGPIAGNYFKMMPDILMLRGLGSYLHDVMKLEKISREEVLAVATLLAS